MNWLAHVFVSKNVIDYQLGNLLADPLKGKIWEGANEQIVAGFKMHCSIDSFTDSNEFVRKSKSRLRHKGYLKGVIVDIVYDYFLLKNWNRYSTVSLDLFINTFYQNATEAVESYPEHARVFVNKVIESNNLTSYGSFDGLEKAFQRIDKRLSARLLAKESAVDYLPALKREIMAIEADFIQFFPQLIEHFQSKSNISFKNHWIR